MKPDEQLHAQMLKIFSTGISVDRVEDNFKELMCCLPQIHAPGLSYNNLFRIIIMRFVDAWDFDVRAIKKSCVHIVHKDGRIIPFETMNLFYRDEKEEIVKRLQEERTNAVKIFICSKNTKMKTVYKIVLSNIVVAILLAYCFYHIDN